MRNRVQEIRNEMKDNGFLMGCLQGKRNGPTVIFMGGIHGNEPSGVQALEIFLKEFSGETDSLNGTVYALKGNPPALSRHQRYIDEDLNRLWSHSRMETLKREDIHPVSTEEKLQLELSRYISDILENESGPFYFFDLHTTSCRTIPFLTVNDMRINRRFAEQYPLPMILGIEEYLEGPVLSYINELGYVSFGFEAGQHEDPRSIMNHLAFIRLTLTFAGMTERSDLSARHYYDYLQKSASGVHEVYEIFYRHEITPHESFEMLPGFVNFTRVEKDTPLAMVNGVPEMAEGKARLFMPLYQKQGDDGYFLIRRIRYFWLRLSDWLRRIRMDRIFPLLPGIRWESGRRDALIVNKRIARFFAREIFHLFGYRSKQLDQSHIRMKNRESVARENEYRDSAWFVKR